MIDIETQVFNYVATRVRAVYPGIFITGEYVRSPNSFPCISIVETENEIDRNTRSADEIENYIRDFYEVSVYSNKKTGKKSECKEIIAEVDKHLKNLGFTRTMLSPVPNLEDASIYRMTARYRAIVSKNEVIYRR